MNKKLLKIFGIALGVLTIILAIVVFTQNVGYYESSHSYGGDAYTGIQNASAQAANNVKYVGEMIRFAMGSMMLVMGLAMVLGSLCIRTEKKTIAVKAPVFAAPNGYQAPVTQPDGNWNCSKCSFPNEPDSRFCQNCGTPRP